MPQVAHKNPVSRERAATLGLSVACVVAFSVLGTSGIAGHLVDPTAVDDIATITAGADGRSSNAASIDRCFRAFEEQFAAANEEELALREGGFQISGLPMMDKESVRMYCQYLPVQADVLEWGLGGSTLFFPQFVQGAWVTVEHDESWSQKLLAYIDANPSKYPYLSRDRFQLRSAAGPLQPWTDGTRAEYEAYIQLPAALQRTFDVIVVDGRARVECAKSIIRNKLLRTEDSLVFVHDWEREEYHKGVLSPGLFEVVAEETTAKRHFAVLRRARGGSGNEVAGRRVG